MNPQFTNLVITVESTKDLILILNILNLYCNVFYKDIEFSNTYSLIFDIQNDHIQKLLEQSQYITKKIELLSHS